MENNQLFIYNTLTRTQSEYRDSNPEPHGPKPRALPNCATLRGHCHIYAAVVVTMILSIVVFKTAARMMKLSIVGIASPRYHL